MEVGMFTARLAIAFVFTCILFGQSERGNITGIVSDPQGAAIAGAAVKITSANTNQVTSTVTGGSGDFNAPNLSPGAYRIEVTAPGFKRFVQENAIVAAASTMRTDIQLQLGQISETVEVSAQAVLIQSDNAKVSTQVQNKLVDELPLVVGGEMRSPFNLVAIAPEAKGRGGQMSLGGGQAAAWDATLDGHSVGTNRLVRHGRSGAEYAFGGSSDRVYRGHQRLQGRIWPSRRRCHDVRLQVGYQPVPRQLVRLPPQRRHGRARLLPGAPLRVPPE
jgi:hypothetical protein